jgi:hypothetical protein
MAMKIDAELLEDEGWGWRKVCRWKKFGGHETDLRPLNTKTPIRFLVATGTQSHNMRPVIREYRSKLQALVRIRPLPVKLQSLDRRRNGPLLNLSHGSRDVV